MGDGIYFVSTGDCAVNVKDHNGKERAVHRLLSEGDHFGEISTMYGCEVTVSVISRSYNIMARINILRFRELIIEYPEYKDKLKKHIMRYKDPKIFFLRESILQVDYLRNISKEVLTDIIYNMKPKYYSPGEIILKADMRSRSESMMLVEYGVIEVYTEMEFNEFVIEYLHSGSIINDRTYLTEDWIYTNMRCFIGCKVLELSIDTLELLLLDHVDFS